MKICGSCNLYNVKQKRLRHYVQQERNWFRKNDYRLAMDGESACFNEVILYSKSSRWVTILEDSIELSTTAGLHSQAFYRQVMNCGTPCFLFTMIDDTALQVAFVAGMLEEPTVHVSDPGEKNKDLLFYEDEHLESLDVEKELPFLDITQHQADDVWLSKSENQALKLMGLCHLLGIDYSIAKTGFTEFFQDESLVVHLSESHRLYPLSFCIDERKISEPLTMAEGRPAMELLRSTVVSTADGFDCRFDWINRGGEGGELYLGLLGDAIHDDLIRRMKGLPLHYVLSEVAVTCDEKSYQSTARFAPKLNGDTHIYECEVADFQLPAGIVIPSKIRRRLDRKGLYHDLEIPKIISTSFRVQTQMSDLQGVTFAVMPILNTYRGDARYDFEGAPSR
jgi:hypothetical protein